MKRRPFCVCALTMLVGTAVSAVFYVHPDSTQNNIQACLDMCGTGDTVLVGAGTYYEHITWPGTNGIKLLSEFGRDTTFIDGGDSGRVIWMGADADSNTAVRGFTIQNGYSDSAGGAGIRCCDSSRALIEDNRFLDNWSNTGRPQPGGGLGCNSSFPKVRDNLFEGNRSCFGGGIGLFSSSPEITGNTIVGNKADTLGGGIVCEQGSHPAIRHNIIEYDSAGQAGGGGGIGLYMTCKPLIDSNTIRYNKAAFGAGIYMLTGCHPTITWCTIDSNAGNGGGTGIYAEGGSLPFISHCSIRNNIGNGAVGMWGYNTCPTIEFSTISNNRSVGVMPGPNSACTLRWCRVVDNVGYAVAPVGNGSAQALFNWWGHSTGPFHPDSNPGGLGDTVGNGVTFQPWLGSDVIRYVHPDSSFNTIQSALDACSENEAVCVGPATYVENLYWPHTNGIRFASHHLDCDSVVIDGDSAGHVIACTTRVDTTTWMEGLTIRNGLSHDTAPGGGGLYCRRSSPTVRGCLFTENRTPLAREKVGGAILAYDSAAPYILDNTITDNQAMWGAGIGCRYGCSPLILGNTIKRNTASSTTGLSGAGGIACLVSCIPEIRGNAIDSNVGLIGGGILCNIGSDAVLDSNWFRGDRAAWGGAISCNHASSPTITRCVMTQCVADTMGGGIYLDENSSPTISCCDISDNSSPVYYGGGIFCDNNSSPDIDSCRITNNSQCGLVARLGAMPDVDGCDIYGNTVYGVFNTGPDTIEVLWCFWGDSSGPYHPTQNPDGLGDTISDCVLWDPWIGVRGPQEPKRLGRSPQVTMLRGVLRLTTSEAGSLLDISGRQVMDLEPGLNDIRHVAPGVYFVRREDDITTTKAVVHR